METLDLRKIAGLATLLQYKRNEVIIAQGNVDAECMYILLNGTATMYKNYKKPNQVMLKTIVPGVIIGEQSLFCASPHNETIIADDNLALISINRWSFNNLCTSNDVMFSIVEQICRRLDETNRELVKYKYVADSALSDLGKDISEYTIRALLPKEHIRRDVAEPAEFAEFVTPSGFTCPNCSYQFDGRVQLASKLRPLNSDMMRADLRKKYQNFEPCWYDIETCPECLFSAQPDYFKKSVALMKDAYQERLASIKSNINPTITYPKTLEQVFSSYYLALMCCDGFENSVQLRGRLWLQLAWLYGDDSQPDMEKLAFQNSFDAYREFYGNSTLDPAVAQVCCLILGSLSLSLKESEDAMNFLYLAKSAHDGKPVYKQIADRELDYLREFRKELKTNTQL